MKNKLLLASFLTTIFFGTETIFSQNNTNSSLEIESLVAKKRAYNKKFGFGYRVQIYYGNETKARSLRSKFRLQFPEIYNTLKYNQPYWEVQVGTYKTKLEAKKALLKFQENFSGIIVIPMNR
jgi:septal ring-binding cell division protein DamX